ncbi:MAG TPA: methyl-accepting chemotaxis protein [Ruminiclostridium sp.]|nr:methyl-accepting chemotaxis protein [Ruminiclostridium sp.]
MRTKLILGFLSVVFITCIVGYIAVINISTLNDRDTFLYEKTTRPIVSLGKIGFSFNKIGGNTRDLFLADNPEGIALAKKKIYVSSDSIKNQINEYARTFTDKQDEIEYNKFNQVYAWYFRELQKIIEMVENNQKQEAWTFFKGEHHKSLNATRQQIQKMTDFKIKAAQKASEENTAISKTITYHLMAWVIAGIIIAMAFGLFIAKIINDPVKRLVSAADKLSSGNINLAVNPKTCDELGELEHSFGIMIENIKSQVHAVEKIAMGETAVEIRVKSEDDVLSKSIVKVAGTIRNLVFETLALSQAAVEGKLHIRGHVENFQGVYNEIIAGVNTTLDTVVKPIDESSKILEQIASGNLTVRMTGDYKGDYSLIKNSINRLVESFNDALKDVAQAVQATADASRQISASSEVMASGAQKQSIQTTEVASAVEEMTSTIIETTHNSLKAVEAAKDAGVIAKEGGEVVNQTIEGMNRVALVVKKSAETVESLGKSSDEIGEIIQVIDDIADQTNLLALNAAIEAARAGEQGRGFAVVADEVRKLAERTTKATKEIADMIKNIQRDTSEAVVSMKEGTSEVEKGKELANKAGKALQQIITGSEDVVNIISLLATASEQQSITAEEISKNIEAINNITTDNAAGVQQIANSSEDLGRLTVNLQEMISKFKIEKAAVRSQGLMSLHL